MAPICPTLTESTKDKESGMPPSHRHLEIDRYLHKANIQQPFVGAQRDEMTAELIVNILQRYRLPDAVAQHKPLGVADKLLAQVKTFIAKNEPISLVLPAFPFKSANKTTKVLGTLPDKGEEVALRHLNSICKEIEKVYGNGARLVIVSDGLVYNDILGVSEQEVWRYGQALRQLAKECDCSQIHFARLRDLTSHEQFEEPLSEEAYVQHAPHIRAEIARRFLPQDFDVCEAIASDPDVRYTYCGYAKFLETELAISLKEMNLPTMKKRQYCKDVAKKMIVRGKAFAEAIACAFPSHLRLSIHPSTDTKKLSIALVPQKSKTQMTPWHSALVLALDGSITMAHAQTVSLTTHELISHNGRPLYFREKSDLFNWPDVNVDFEYLYPSGMRITLRNWSTKSLVSTACMWKLSRLLEICPPITLCDLENVVDRSKSSPKSEDA